MKVFLAGMNGKNRIIPIVHGNAEKESAYDRVEIPQTIREHSPFILESFYYMNDETERLMQYYGDVMIDSGAFTFMGGFNFRDNSKGVDFYEYADRYSEFIKRNGIQKFFELDVDSCIGYDRVKDLRRYIERKTNRQPIPVWHSTRGKDEFLRSCEEYPYVALGGIVGGEWNTAAERYIPWFIREAHKRGAKIHGLGFTKIDKLREFHFDSVDSTAWTAGNRFGFVCKFDGKTIQKTNVPKGQRISATRAVAMNNYIEWIKFQRYALSNL